MVTDASLAGIKFQGSDEHEHFQFYFRQHWIRLLKPFVITVLWTVCIVAAGYMMFFRLEVTDPQTRHGLLIGLFVVFAAVHLSFLRRLYTYFLYVIIVTDRRVHRIKKTLFATDDHQSMDLWMFQDIDKWQHGPIQNLLGFGSLIMEAQDTTLKLHFVPRIAKIYDKISHLKEEARERSAARRREG